MWEPELNFFSHCSRTLFKSKIISLCIFKQNMELLSTTWRRNQRGQFTLRNINLRDNFSSIPHWSTNRTNEMVVNLNKYTFKILLFISKNLLQWNKYYFAKTIFLPFKIMCAYICVYIYIYLSICILTFVEVCIWTYEIYGTIVNLRRVFSLHHLVHFCWKWMHYCFFCMWPRFYIVVFIHN